MFERVLLGIDPGYDRIGWSIGEVTGQLLSVRDCGCILTTKSKTLFERYKELSDQLESIITQYHPKEAALESLFFFKNKKTALHVSEARGVIQSCIFRNAIQFFEYTPLQIKQAVTGYGRADKKAVEKMVLLQIKKNNLIEQKMQIDDTVDAIAILMTHAITHRV